MLESPPAFVQHWFPGHCCLSGLVGAANVRHVLRAMVALVHASFQLQVLRNIVWGPNRLRLDALVLLPAMPTLRTDAALLMNTPARSTFATTRPGVLSMALMVGQLQCHSP